MRRAARIVFHAAVIALLPTIAFVAHEAWVRLNEWACDRLMGDR